VTSDRRITAAPDIPTFREMGLQALSHSEWWGVFAPKGTPKDVIGKLNAAVGEALVDPAVQSRLAEVGTEILPPERQHPTHSERS
jgi:tripartite-type tricarboxylate transporter receptor subunit TctC